MTFLQPWMLAALPLAAIPVIIHLIHQRRFQTIDWGAMRFLMEAQRMARGYAKLRQYLILLVRALAIAFLVFLIGRPLTTGWLGSVGSGRPDTTLILVDRSASMMQQDAGGVRSKLEAGAAQLEQALGLLGSGRFVLIDSVSLHPTELVSLAELSKSPMLQPASSTADLPAMLQVAYDYVTTNRVGQTEIWVCSDLRSTDWNAESGRWKVLRESFQKLKQNVRIHLLAYPSTPPANVAVRVTDVQRHVSGDAATLFLSVRLNRRGGDAKLKIPLRFEVDGNVSELPVEIEGADFDLKNHSIPLPKNVVRGWGRVSIPADLNPADDEFYFAFDDPPARKTFLVAPDRDQLRPIEIAATSSPDAAVKSEVEFVTPDQWSTIAWEQAGLVFWDAPIPDGAANEAIRKYVDGGGQIVFIPPPEPSGEKIFDARWTNWESSENGLQIETWRGDQDLLARTQSGSALPVGDLKVQKHCGIEGDVVSLATLTGGSPLLARVTTDHGGVYFLATSPLPQYSTLGTNGVALYALVQRALTAGTAALSKTKQLNAGDSFPNSTGQVHPVAEQEGPLSTEYPHHAGVYQSESGLYAVNRGENEDSPATLGDHRIQELFNGLDFDRVDDQSGNMKPLAREAWRLCVAAMMIAVVAEAGLCLPRTRQPESK